MAARRVDVVWAESLVSKPPPAVILNGFLRIVLLVVAVSKVDVNAPDTGWFPPKPLQARFQLARKPLMPPQTAAYPSASCQNDEGLRIVRVNLANGRDLYLSPLLHQFQRLYQCHPFPQRKLLNCSRFLRRRGEYRREPAVELKHSRSSAQRRKQAATLCRGHYCEVLEVQLRVLGDIHPPSQEPGTI